MADDKLLSVQKHEVADLLIWNYTQKCQFDRIWTPETTMARGLITDLEGNIVARPFQKFFNYEEHTGEDSRLPAIPLEPFRVYEKLDGSLGILYWLNGVPQIATRGSFISDQAVRGTAILHGYLRDNPSLINDINPEYTYLFEIIYPENRIVVDYKGLEDIILLAVIDTESGVELDLKKESLDSPFVGEHDFSGNIEELKKLDNKNREGFVLVFQSGFRVKVKFEEYVRLHRLITGVNAKTIWELLKNNESTKELLERVPEEFYKWVENTVKQLTDEFNVAEAVAWADYEKVKGLKDRKAQAKKVFMLDSKRQKKLSGVIFKMLDKKPYEDLIWKMLRPRADTPFKQDIDA